MYSSFGELRDFSFKDQILRASLSIMNNIAEGYARRSDKAFRSFLLISKILHVFSSKLKASD